MEVIYLPTFYGVCRQYMYIGSMLYLVRADRLTYSGIYRLFETDRKCTLGKIFNL